MTENNPPHRSGLVTKRAETFRDDGLYDVFDEQGRLIAKLFRDPESREWYEDSLPGQPQTHYTERWRGSTQAEALDTIARKRALREGPKENPRDQPNARGDVRYAIMTMMGNKDAFDDGEHEEAPAGFSGPSISGDPLMVTIGSIAGVRNRIVTFYGASGEVDAVDAKWDQDVAEAVADRMRMPIEPMTGPQVSEWKSRMRHNPAGDAAWDKIKADSARWRQERAERVARIERLFHQSPAIRGMSRESGGEPRMAIMSGELSDKKYGDHRVTFFGPDGPHGHATKFTARQIAEETSEYLYPPLEPMEDADVLAWTSTKEFEKGAALTVFIQGESTLRWFAQKADKTDWAQEIITRANDVGTRGGTVNSRGKPYDRDQLEAAIKIIHEGIKKLPTPNPSRKGLVANPPWVTKALASSYETIEARVPPRWMPELAAVSSRGNILSGKFVEFGCGAYGCVLPTLDPGVVLKVTTDESEATFAAEMAHDLVAPICVEYTMVATLNQFHEGRQIHLLWRESADQVGNIEKALGGAKGAYAIELVKDQHQAAQIAFDAVYTGKSAAMIRARVSFWLEMCERIATQVKVPELRALGAGLVEVYERQRILFGDIHAGNLGLVKRAGKESWVITDPGNVTYVHETNPAKPRAR